MPTLLRNGLTVHSPSGKANTTTRLSSEREHQDLLNHQRKANSPTVTSKDDTSLPSVDAARDDKCAADSMFGSALGTKIADLWSSFMSPGRGDAQLKRRTSNEIVDALDDLFEPTLPAELRGDSDDEEVMEEMAHDKAAQDPEKMAHHRDEPRFEWGGDESSLAMITQLSRRIKREGLESGFEPKHK